MKPSLIKKIASLLFITAIVVAGYAKKDRIQYLFFAEDQAKAGGDGKGDFEEMLLLNNLFKNADGEYHLSATMRIVDHADREHSVKNAPYTIQKSENSLYLRSGSVEILNTPVGYISVSNDTKDIVLSPSREIEVPETFTARQLKSMLESQKYQFKKLTNGDTVKLSLVNEGHAVCKEYSITATIGNGKIIEVYTRYADPAEPEDSGKQKEITLFIQDYGRGITNAQLLDMNRIIDTTGQNVRTAKAYTDFSIIQ